MRRVERRRTRRCRTSRRAVPGVRRVACEGAALAAGLGGDRAARGKAGPPRPSAGAVPQRARRSSRRCGAKAGPGKVVPSAASGKLVCTASGVERSAADSDRHGSGLSGTAVVLLANDTATRRRDNESFRAAASLPARLGNHGHRSDQLEGRRQFWVAQRRAGRRGSPDAAGCLAERRLPRGSRGSDQRPPGGNAGNGREGHQPTGSGAGQRPARSHAAGSEQLHSHAERGGDSSTRPARITLGKLAEIWTGNRMNVRLPLRCVSMVLATLGVAAALSTPLWGGTPRPLKPPGTTAESRRLTEEKVGTLPTREGLRLRLAADLGDVRILTQNSDQIGRASCRERV